MSGLSDTLRELAAAGDPSESPPPRKSPDAQEVAEPAADSEDQDMLVADVEEEDDDYVSDDRLVAATAATGVASGRRPIKRKAPQNTAMKEIGAPILVTVGLLLCVPAFWALMIITGTWTSERETAGSMAKVMLVCWPIAIALIAGGIYFFFEAQKEKKQKELDRAARTQQRR